MKFPFFGKPTRAPQPEKEMPTVFSTPGSEEEKIRLIAGMERDGYKLDWEGDGGMQFSKGAPPAPVSKVGSWEDEIKRERASGRIAVWEGDRLLGFREMKDADYEREKVLVALEKLSGQMVKLFESIEEMKRKANP